MTRFKTATNRFRRILLVTTLVCLLSCGAAFSMGMDMGFGDEIVPDPEPAPAPVLEITPGPFSSPVGIDLTYKGRGLSYLLVTDVGKGTVNKVNPQIPDSVEKLFEIGGIPLGVAEYRRSIYVGNRSEGSVDIYRRSRKGHRLVRQIKTENPMQPNDIAVDPKARRLFVADGLANDVKIFTLKGRLVRTLDGFGDLFEPKSVAIHPPSKTIAISDSGDPRIGMPASVQIYDYSGSQLLRKTGSFSAPRGVALSVDRLFVADALLGQVLVFNREDGRLLGSFGRYGTDPGQLLFPLDVAFDEKSESLYVVNNRMGRIVTYAPADFQPVEVTQ